MQCPHYPLDIGILLFKKNKKNMTSVFPLAARKQELILIFRLRQNKNCISFRNTKENLDSLFSFVECLCYLDLIQFLDFISSLLYFSGII